MGSIENLNQIMQDNYDTPSKEEADKLKQMKADMIRKPIIYELPVLDKKFETDILSFSFDNQPSPKLMKYGFNNLSENLDIMEITSNPHYKAGLNFDFDRKDEDSIAGKSKKIFDVKHLDQTFTEFWEIMNLFGMLELDQQILTSNPTVIEHIVSSHKKMTGTKHKIHISDKGSKNKITLILQKYSDIDIDENAISQMIINDLPHFLSVQDTGSSMVIQIFGMQTGIMAELIYYLNTLYSESYIIKPMTTSEISDSKYLILLGMKKSIKLSIPKHSKNSYLISLGIEPIPNDLVTIIQCANSELIPKKFVIYSKIKNYLNSKVYEGATYQEMIQQQNANTNKWLEMFIDLGKMESLFDNLIKKTDSVCDHHTEWANLFG